ncbi:MAG: hypothetical protein K9L22_06460 [Methylococcaceae bacterium]|nr:hypothetical protein [Methylococcaceae bacterium]
MNKLLITLGPALLVSGLAQSPMVYADVVHADDTIVQGSVCAGFDCVNGENFGADTIRLKENNLRIHFDDTSSSGSFPSNDWRIIANDQANGGQNYMAIEDSSAGRQIFRVDAGAPSNALYVRSNGFVGFGTSTPALNLHTTTGNSPGLRLEQDSSSGFSAQSWDVAGNETNFFIRDVTNGSKLPFKIQPGASNNSLFIASDGDIGLETSTPDGQLDVAHSANANNHAFLIDPNSNVGINIDNGFMPNGLLDVQTTGGVSRLTVASDGNVGVGTSTPEQPFHLSHQGTTLSLFESSDNGAVQIRMRSNSDNRRFLAIDSSNIVKSQIVFGNNEIQLAGQTSTTNKYATFNATGLVVNGSISTTASGQVHPDYVFKSNYQLMSLADLKSFISTNEHLPDIPSAADVAKNGIDITKMQINLLKKIEELTLYTLEQQKTIDELKIKLSSLEVSKN